MIGRTLSHYRITSALGAGGMGEVYRATDTTLGRDVAIKVLPGEVAQDPERLARFRREAQLLAALNHPNIAAIHGLEEVEGTPFLALELVEGEDLSERLKRGAIAVEEAVAIARQIAEALEAAHEKGIIHRDLKPANVKVTPEGQVKVLDFGLAKAWAGDPGTGASSVDASQSPTLAHTGTAAGIILGTAAYMSPEQAMGKAVDKRADIWAFGVVLFEMLTGERVFNGENASEILASVIKEAPDWERLPAGTPRPVTRLLRRCLRKKPRERLHDISDARLELEDAEEAGESGGAKVQTRATGRERLAWGLAAVLPIATAALTAWWLQPPPARGALQLSIPLAPAGINLIVDHFAVSPDGSRVAFPGQEGDGPRRLYVRALDEPAARGLPGTEGVAAPFFSPDGQWVAFRADNSTLKKVPVDGGPVVTVAEGSFRGSWGAWTDDGWIILNQPWADHPGRLVRVPADGGPLEPLDVSQADAGVRVNHVRAIPGAPAVLLGIGALSSAPEGVAIAVQSLETGARSVLAPGGVLPRFLGSGHVVYRHTGRLMIGKLDLEGMRLTGPRVPLQAITGEEDVGYFDVSLDGVFVYAPNAGEGRPVHPAWADRSGATTPLGFEAFVRDPRLSPDATRVTSSDQDVWVVDLDRGTRTRISSAGGGAETATWSPDGQWIAWAALRAGEARGLFRRRSDGSGPEERLWSDGRHFHVASWSPQGLVLTVDDPTTGWDVLLLDPDDPGELLPLLSTPFNETSARVSPDGRLLTFVSDETDQDEVYVQAFPEPRGKVQISIGGGTQPVWRPGTREIIYRGEGQIMSVPLGPEDPLVVPVPRRLMGDRFWGRDSTVDHTWYAIHPDGRLLVVEALEDDRRRDLRVVLDWMEAAGLGP